MEPQEKVVEGEFVESTAIVARDPMSLLDQAVRQGLDVEKLRELTNLEREWRADKAKAEFATAMAKFNTLKEVVKHNRSGKTAGSVSFTYSDYPAMVKAITPWLTECGLSFSHRQDPPVITDGKVSFIMVYCDLMHSAGFIKPGEGFPAIPDMRLDGKVSPSQLIQLSLTYAKRQTLAMALGVATSEDKNDSDSHGVEPIPPEQASHLKEAIAELENPERFMEKFLELMKVEAIENITLPDYGKAIKAIIDTKKLREQKARTTKK